MLLFYHVYNGIDDQSLTQGEFEFWLSKVPRSIRRRFGYGFEDAETEEARQAEVERMDAYTDFGDRPFGKSPKDAVDVPEWELPDGYTPSGGEDAFGEYMVIAHPDAKRRAKAPRMAAETFEDEDSDIAGMERITP